MKTSQLLPLGLLILAWLGCLLPAQTVYSEYRVKTIQGDHVSQLLLGSAEPDLIEGSGFVVFDSTPESQPLAGLQFTAVTAASLADYSNPQLTATLYKDGLFHSQVSYTSGFETVNFLHPFEKGHRYAVLLVLYDTARWTINPPLPLTTHFEFAPFTQGSPAPPTVSVAGDWDAKDLVLSPPEPEQMFAYMDPPVRFNFVPSGWDVWPPQPPNGTGDSGWATNYGVELTLENQHFTQVTWELSQGGTRYVDAHTQTVNSRSSSGQWVYRLPDLTYDPELRGVNGGYQLKVTAENAWGGTGTFSTPINSFRALSQPAMSWEVRIYRDNGTLFADAQTAVSGFEGRSDLPICPDLALLAQTEARLEVDLMGWGHPGNPSRALGPDYQLQAKVLLKSENGSYNVPRAGSVFGPTNPEDPYRVTFSGDNFLRSRTWQMAQGHNFQEYPQGAYIEVIVDELVDGRSGNVAVCAGGCPFIPDSPGSVGWTSTPYPNHRLRIHQADAGAVCGTQSLAVVNGANQLVARIHHAPGTDLQLRLLAQFPGGTVNRQRLRMERGGTAFPCKVTAESMTSGTAVTVTLADSELPADNLPFTLIVEAGDSSSLPSGCSSAFATPLRTQIEVLRQGAVNQINGLGLVLSDGQTTAKVDPTDGAVNFGFHTQVHEVTQPLQWRWSWFNPGTLKTLYWNGANWFEPTSQTPAESFFYEIGNSQGNSFAGRWTFNADGGRISDADDEVTPFAGMVAGFFPGSVGNTIEVTVDARFSGQPAISLPLTLAKEPFDLTPPPTPARVQALEVALNQGSGLQWSQHVWFPTGYGSTVFLRLKTSDTSNLWGTLNTRLAWLQDGGSCPDLTTAFNLSNPGFITDGDDHYYQFTISNPAWLNHLQTVGSYQLRVYQQGESCGDTVPEARRVTLSVTQPLQSVPSLVVRLHFTDHLGSTVATKAFRPVSVRQGGNQGGEITLYLDGGPVVFAGETPEYHYQDPFGGPLDVNVSVEARARYTDHEWDGDTAMNYMKGRYQVPSWPRFTRPDPQRDWDWQNPHSLNLYQYVRNDPINGWDPTGFEEFPDSYIGPLQPGDWYESDRKNDTGTWLQTVKYWEQHRAHITVIINGWTYANIQNELNVTPLEVYKSAGGTETLFATVFEPYDWYLIGKDIKSNGFQNYHIVSAAPIIPFSIIKAIKKMASSFDNFQCVECVEELIKELKKVGVSGKKLEVQIPSSRGNIWADSGRFGPGNISLNGRHQAIEINGIVFDNNWPDGIPRKEWEQQMQTVSGSIYELNVVNEVKF